MEKKLVYAFVIIVAVFLLVLPFALNFPIDKKVLLTATGIAFSASFIKNKKVRYLIVSICLFVVLFAIFKWHLFQ